MKISQLAKAAGVGVETIRYYQRRKLLAVPQPISGSTSKYDAHDLRTLRFIRRAKGLGFTLEEIRRLISLAGTGLVGAVFASSCCVVPLVLLTLDISAAWMAKVGW